MKLFAIETWEYARVLAWNELVYASPLSSDAVLYSSIRATEFAALLEELDRRVPHDFTCARCGERGTDKEHMAYHMRECAA